MNLLGKSDKKIPGNQLFMLHAFKIVVVLLWVVLFAVLLQRDYFVKNIDIQESTILLKSRQESYAGVYFNNEHIGYVKNNIVKNNDGTLSIAQHADLHLYIAKQNYPVQMDVTAQLTSGFLLKQFSFALSSPFYEMTAEGEVDGSRVSFVLSTGRSVVRDSVQLDSPPFLSINQRGYLLEQNLQPGEKIKIAYFDPLSLSGKDTIVVYKGVEKTLVKGRILLLHRFEEKFSGMRISSWLDDNGKVIKEESPAGFIFLAEPEFKATAIRKKGTDILQSVAVPFKGDLSDIGARDTIAFQLQLPEDVVFDLDGGRQHVQGDIITLSKESTPAVDASSCVGHEKDRAPTAYIQSNHQKIINLAEEITATSDSAIGKVRAIAAWVYENLEKRPVLGIPDSVATLDLMKGDCNEHAVLFAALSRAVGIPARIAAGVTYHKNAFYYHAWNEVCVGGSWLSLDTTVNQLPADLGHIRFVVGGTHEQIRIGALLGKLKINPVE